MLVISRKPGQEILVGHDIKLVVLHVGHDYVRIGIDAPETFSILRGELSGVYPARAPHHSEESEESTNGKAN